MYASIFPFERCLETKDDGRSPRSRPSFPSEKGDSVPLSVNYAGGPRIILYSFAKKRLRPGSIRPSLQAGAGRGGQQSAIFMPAAGSSSFAMVPVRAVGAVFVALMSFRRKTLVRGRL